jgi:putative methyltransferase (TIGR04325 family)
MKFFVRFIYRYLRDTYLNHQFSRDGYSYFKGVFSTFEQAIQSAPKSKPIGYDNTDLAHEYRELAEKSEVIYPFDYPILFWLKSIFDDAHGQSLSIFDFGGNVGTHFYLYQKYINYPEEIQWKVCDLPEITKAGKSLSKTKPSLQLSFTDEIGELDAKDILIASGSIQYVKNLSELLDPLSIKPKHLLLNRLPLYDGEQFVTLQNGGKVFYPQYVFNRSNFIDSLKNIGYELIDIWEDHLDSCIIPFHPEKSIKFYHGLYCRLNSGVK